MSIVVRPGQFEKKQNGGFVLGCVLTIPQLNNTPPLLVFDLDDPFRRRAVDQPSRPPHRAGVVAAAAHHHPAGLVLPQVNTLSLSLTLTH